MGRLTHRKAPSTLAFLVGFALASCAAPAPPAASGRLPLRAEVGVGHRLPPYQPVASAEVPLDVHSTLLHVDFRSDHDEPRAGIAIRVDAPPSAPDPGSKVCVDDSVLGELATKGP